MYEWLYIRMLRIQASMYVPEDTSRAAAHCTSPYTNNLRSPTRCTPPSSTLAVSHAVDLLSAVSDLLAVSQREADRALEKKATSFLGLSFLF